MKPVAYVFILFVTLGCGTALQAQNVGWTITPKIGVFTPLSSLSETDSTESKLATSLALGLSFEIDFRNAPLSVRANVDVAANSKIESDGAAPEFAADQLNVVGDLLIRPFSRDYIVQPYVLLGAGLKRYTFTDEQFSTSTSEQMFTAHVGGGVIFDFGAVKLSAELSDYISSREPTPGESKGQHDLFGMVGLRIPLN
jgi:hypothetical protein